MGTFQSFWHGPGLPVYQRLALKSFIDHGHRFVLYTYDALEAPQGVEIRDAGEILPRERLFLYKAGVGLANASGFSDLFRFKLLHDKGGWWVDTDVVCLSPDVPEPETHFGWQDHRLVGTAILRFPQGDAFARALFEAADRTGSDIGFGEIGPALITRLTKERGLEDRLASRPEIYPVRPMEALHLLAPARTEEIRAQIGGAPLLHLWNEIMGLAAVLLWVAPPHGSYMRELFTRHGFPMSDRLCYRAGEIERLTMNFLRSRAAEKEHHRANRLAAEVETLRASLAAAEAELGALRG